MTSRRRRIAASVAVAVVVTLVSGCGLYIFPSPEMEDLAAVEDSLNLEDLGQVVCGQWNRPTPIDGNPYFRFFGVVGADNYDELISRLEGLDFTLGDRGQQDDGTVMHGPHGEDVIVTPYVNPVPPGAFTPKDCDIPDDGLVTLSFTLNPQ